MQATKLKNNSYHVQWDLLSGKWAQQVCSASLCRIIKAKPIGFICIY